MNIRGLIQRREMSICFSENMLSEPLWLKYAKNHTGFAIEYDPYCDEDFMCGKSIACKLCLNYKFGLSLYPVYYTNDYDMIYDATEYAKITILIELVYNHVKDKESILFNELPDMNWAREKIALLKHKCHEHDNEWRIVYPGFYDGSNRPFMFWRPKSIIFGLRMNKVEQDLVYHLAKEAGINCFYKCIINSKNKLDVVRIQLQT